MSIQAKFTCEKVEEQLDPNGQKKGESVSMRAVYGDSEENKSFSEATPSATVNLYITNKSAFGAFVQGRNYIAVFDQRD